MKSKSYCLPVLDSNVHTMPAETLREIARNEKEKACFRGFLKFLQKNLSLPGTPFTGSPVDILRETGLAGEIGLRMIGHEIARKEAIKSLEKGLTSSAKKFPRHMFWRFKTYKRFLELSKFVGKGSAYASIFIPYAGCLIELVDCYLDVLPSESFEEKFLYFWIKR